MSFSVAFVDEENVGAQYVKDLPLSTSKTVIVVSKNEKVRKICWEKGFKFDSSYPSGKNQADFHILASLGAIIGARWATENTVKATFEIHSKDKNLAAAFKNQCQLSRVKCSIKQTLTQSTTQQAFKQCKKYWVITNQNR